MKRLSIAALFASSAFFAAGVAHAEPLSAFCLFDSILARETVTSGNAFVGDAYGAIAGQEPGENVSITCELRVNGETVDSTPTGAGVQLAATAGRVVTDFPADTDTVALCAVWTEGSDAGEDCHELTTLQIPPQEVIDLLDTVFDLIAETGPNFDPFLCGLLLTGGVPALVNITTSVTTISMDADDCDLYVAGELWVDFLPYGA